MQPLWNDMFVGEKHFLDKIGYFPCYVLCVGWHANNLCLLKIYSMRFRPILEETTSKLDRQEYRMHFYVYLRVGRSEISAVLFRPWQVLYYCRLFKWIRGHFTCSTERQYYTVLRCICVCIHPLWVNSGSFQQWDNFIHWNDQLLFQPHLNNYSRIKINTSEKDCL